MSDRPGTDNDVLQFVLSRHGSPVLAKPVPERAMSRELDLNLDGSLSVPKQANGQKGTDIIQALEAQADEM